MLWLGTVIVIVVALAAVTYMGLPVVLRAMGLHRHYAIPQFDLDGRRALIICTSHDKMDPTNKATGAFGSEFTVPYFAFVDAGLEVDMASIKGGEIPLQPGSWSWPLSSSEDQRFMASEDAMQKLRNSKAVTEIEIANYDVIFMAGGWGAAYDLMQSETLAELLTEANAAGKIIGSVCHGALGLCSAKGLDGRPLVEGRR